MKKAITLATLFVMVFTMAVDITLTTAEKAHADVVIIYCSRDTGTNCPTQANPYYLYVQDRHGRRFVGCCNANSPD
jgi:hypothetical protein